MAENRVAVWDKRQIFDVTFAPRNLVWDSFKIWHYIMENLPLEKSDILKLARA